MNFFKGVYHVLFLIFYSSDQLVNLLEFIGLTMQIPSSVMGMTVLAWGNSIGDWTTNGALSR